MLPISFMLGYDGPHISLAVCFQGPDGPRLKEPPDSATGPMPREAKATQALLRIQWLPAGNTAVMSLDPTKGRTRRIPARA